MRIIDVIGSLGKGGGGKGRWRGEGRGGGEGREGEVERRVLRGRAVLN